MPYKIRTKLIIAFFAIIFPFLLITGIIAFYNQNEMRKFHHALSAVTKKMQIVGQMQLLMTMAVMPANDYIITGDKKYIEKFGNLARDLEKELNELDTVLAPAGVLTSEEKALIKDLKIAWLNIKELSGRIFAIQNPVASKDAAKLMEEMDYKWSYPAIERLKKWHEIDEIEYRTAIERTQMTWVQSWTVMLIGALIMLALGVFFVFYYSKLFVRPIKVIHNGADTIAGGDFKTRLVLKTGDEIEQMANAMNKMAAQLDSLYSNMQAMVDERTAELKESEERFRSVSESAPDAIICLNGHGIIYFWNNKAEEMFGYKADEVMNRSMHDVICPERYKQKAAERFKVFSRTGTGPVVGKTMEREGLKKDGTEFPVELSISAVNIKGEWHATGIIRDITARKETEKRLAEQMDFLERFHKAAVQREFRIKGLRDENEALKKKIEEMEKG